MANTVKIPSYQLLQNCTTNQSMSQTRIHQQLEMVRSRKKYFMEQGKVNKILDEGLCLKYFQKKKKMTLCFHGIERKDQ